MTSGGREVNVGGGGASGKAWEKGYLFYIYSKISDEMEKSEIGLDKAGIINLVRAEWAIYIFVDDQ